MTVISYCIVATIFLILSFILILIRKNLLLKENSIGNFIRSSSFKYIINRLFLSIVSLLLIVICLFFLIRIIPTNEFQESSTIVNHFNKPMLSDGSLLKDLWNYLYNILPFPKKVCTSTKITNSGAVCSRYEHKIINLGYSYAYMKNVSVSQIIKEKAAVSFLIGIIAYILECLIGYPLGIYIARKKGKIVDKVTNFAHIVSLSFPKIIQFYIFSLFFMTVLNLPISFDLNDGLTYIAPLASVVIFGSLSVAYWVKKYITLEENKDYVKLARSKGFSDNYIFYKHVFKNALAPLIRTIPSSLFACLCGYYLLELTFNIPGIGLTLMTAINLKDVYLIQGLILFFSFFSILSYFLGDIIAVLIDKRVVLRKEVSSNEE